VDQRTPSSMAKSREGGVFLCPNQARGSISGLLTPRFPPLRNLQGQGKSPACRRLPHPAKAMQTSTAPMDGSTVQAFLQRERLVNPLLFIVSASVALMPYANACAASAAGAFISDLVGLE
jgi:hypothetical protein